MAPKKPNPMEEPPTASSDEEEETEDEETSSGEEEEDDEETPEPTQLSSPPAKQPASKKPPAAVATPVKSSSSEEETGSDSDSDSDPEPTPKPTATKPMEETTTKARSSKRASKRANETEGTQKDAKRAKKKETGAAGDGEEEEEEPASELKKPGEDTKKQLFQRLWSEDDEIAVLKGMMEFSTKKGIDPYQDMNAFHDFIKKSLHVDVTRTQLMDKIRRLKKKYVNNLKKGIKKGEDVTLSKPHEQKAYELSKKVWGGEGSKGVVDSAAKPNGKAKKVQNQKGNNKPVTAVKADLVNGPKEVEKTEVDNEKETGLKIVDMEKFLLDRSAAGLESYVISNGLNMIEASKKPELEKRWRKLQIAQLELYVERTNLVREQAMLMLDALKSSDDK